jgi:hypothetical protein
VNTVITARCLCGNSQMRLTLCDKIAARLCGSDDDCHCAAHGGRGGGPLRVSLILPMHCVEFDRGAELVLRWQEHGVPEHVCQMCDGVLMLFRDGRTHVWVTRLRVDNPSNDADMELEASRTLLFIASVQGEPKTSPTGLSLCTTRAEAVTRRKRMHGWA